MFAVDPLQQVSVRSLIMEVGKQETGNWELERKSTVIRIECNMKLFLFIRLVSEYRSASSG